MYCVYQSGGQQAKSAKCPAKWPGWVGPLARSGQAWLVSWSLILLRGHSHIQSGGQNLQSVQQIGLGGNLRIGLGGATGQASLWPPRLEVWSWEVELAHMDDV